MWKEQNKKDLKLRHNKPDRQTGRFPKHVQHEIRSTANEISSERQELILTAEFWSFEKEEDSIS